MCLPMALCSIDIKGLLIEGIKKSSFTKEISFVTTLLNSLTNITFGSTIPDLPAFVHPEQMHNKQSVIKPIMLIGLKKLFEIVVKFLILFKNAITVNKVIIKIVFLLIIVINL